MKENVFIKSFSKGISLHLNAELDFKELLKEISYKFAETRNFFGRTVMALSIEGRKVSETEENMIIQTIQENSDLKICCVVGHDDETDQIFFKAMDYYDKRLEGNEQGQFFKGSLINQEVLEIENSVIILGDVESGSAVISSKNIIVLGALKGKAYAGGNGDSNAFIAALEMEPERLKIGDFKYKHPMKKSIWGTKAKLQPKMAVVRDGKIVMDVFTKDLLSTF